MKNIGIKVIAGLIGLSSLALGGNESYGQKSLTNKKERSMYAFEYINECFGKVHKDFSQFVNFYPQIDLGKGNILYLKSLNKNIKKSMKKLPKEEKLEFERGYLQNAVKIMCKTNYKNYKDTLNLTFLDKIMYIEDLAFLDKAMSRKDLKDIPDKKLEFEKKRTQILIKMLGTIANNDLLKE